MGIDRLGGKAPPAPPPLADRATGAVSGPSQAFELGRSEPTGARGTAAVAGSTPAASSALEQLRSGAIDVGRYLDLKVDEATSHLSLPSADLSSIRSALRARLASDPTLVDLVRTATGTEPPRLPDE